MRSCACHKPGTPQRSSLPISGQRLPRLPSHRPIGSTRRPVRHVPALQEPEAAIGCGDGGGGGVGDSPRRWWDSDGTTHRLAFMGTSSDNSGGLCSVNSTSCPFSKLSCRQWPLQLPYTTTMLTLCMPSTGGSSFTKQKTQQKPAVLWLEP